MDTKKQTGSDTDKQTDRQTDRQPDRETERQKDSHRHRQETQRTSQSTKPGPERTGKHNDRKRPERDRNATGKTSPERTGNAFRAQARKTGTGPEQAKQQDRNATGTLEFSIDPPRAGPCRRSAPQPFRNVPFSQKPSLVRVIRGPRGVLIPARRTTRGQALHGWLDRPVCWTNLSSGLGGIAHAPQGPC